MRIIRLFTLCMLMVLAGCATQQQQHTQKSDGPLIAADTSRTIDLTHPPRDMWDRIRRGYSIPNLDTELVDYWTDYYASRPQSLLVMSQRASKYLFHIVDEIEARGLPTELALLPFVESAYNPDAYSRAHASGLWQFIPSTGKYYNLEQNWWLDERRDPIASTDAALNYLSYLYDFQGDWYLALASYNWGEGSVKRAIARNESQNLPGDYLSLTMPEETRNYLPKLQALKNIITDPKRYGITLPDISNEPYFTSVPRTSDIDMTVVAQLAEMSIDDLRMLNPSHNRPVIPANNTTLLLPTNKVETFKRNLASFTGKLSNWKVYQPQRGESFASIAKDHGISVAELRSLNGLNAKQTVASTQLLLPIDAADARITMTAQGTPVTAQATLAAQAQQPRATARRAVARNYRVRKGDTLFAIARKYNTSVSELKKLNKLRNNNIQPGSQLRVPS
ncbi:transglycosylase SLT domain-containing protein [Paenalcaligenes suwonensis]|uniref:transglycosylase SLT domain-containing protein n=1 Tax=Paenalcaligenes suwonensis TaxID=1202713 RepID=UPI0014087C2D|nr:transglycosylase SLT domain-containing protein [Paenalcaligenes suwonensis]NHC60458.1 transglycosylase SLT domain-containing protein [Paenalcaligenes suwonensis]